MVSARLVDSVDSTEEEELRPLPDMMFAAGEEPVGVRVLTYQSSSVLQRIFNALAEDEVDIIRQSTFGKLIDIADKPVFSGRFARYMLSRQLKTKKKHEVWFRFATKPVRFSLREFAIVTGLPCGKFPRKSKMKLKETISEKPYWPTLFGKVDVVTVSSVIKMLYRKTVKDREIRIRYACLALLESVLLPTSLNMKISREHVESIEDLEAFFAYPWGRLAFDMLMGSINERDEVALSQNTIAVKGFALALQLVMVEAVPSLTEVVQDTCSSSDSDSDDAGGNGLDIFTKKHTLNPAHARSEDKKTDVFVRSIIGEDPMRPIDEETLVWSDEETDNKVDNLVALINAGYKFVNSSFTGGVTRADVLRLRDANKLSSKSRKSKKLFPKTQDIDPSYIAGIVLETIKPQVDGMDIKITEACSRVDDIGKRAAGQLDAVLVQFKAEILSHVKMLVVSLCQAHADSRRGNSNIATTRLHEETVPEDNTSPVAVANENTIRNVLENISEYSTPPRSTRVSQDENVTPTTKATFVGGIESGQPVDNTCAQSANSENGTRHHSFSPSLRPPKQVEGPSFSLGLFADDEMDDNGSPEDGDGGRLEIMNDSNVHQHNEDAQSARKSKRQKLVPSRLHENFQCGPHLLSRLRESKKFIFVVHDDEEMSRKYANLMEKLNVNFVFNLAGLAVSGKEIRLLVERPRIFSAKVVDILVRILRAHITPKLPCQGPQCSEFFDTKFTQNIMRTYSKFLQSKVKEEYVFPKCVRQLFPTEAGANTFPTRYYFPFNVGNKHWVGICFDASRGLITVLDCNLAMHKDAAIERILNPIVQMLPYVAKFACLPLGGDPVIQCYDFLRPKSISQNKNEVDSGLMTVLLMATHALYGSDACKHINTEVIVEEGKGAAIMAYEFREHL